MKRTLLPLALLLASCVSATAPPPPRDTPVFDPIAFFAGPTEGTGVLKIAFSKPTDVRVHGTGTLGGERLTLDQTVQTPGKPDEHRQWTITRIAGGYTGVLSDAKGPVAIDVHGARLHLQYHAKKDGLAVEQWLDLAPDGRSAENLLVFRKFGAPVARLAETIRKR